ncbi:MAG TPA: nicotinate-nucleotide--dimethylbenzimidazole phosphoribosyltransferase, partial [Candidatus Omnitrophota bacterium]|nr:nicotinate-nucleotide--dimethylbenzimidazole phosphoribosyltransferase [Candidatus Omnitrophota bacterium]
MIMIENVLLKTAPMDAAMMMKAQIHLDNLTKPAQSLGKLENFAKRVVGITRNPRPIFKNKIIFTLAADHGVAREGVSSFPQKVTEQMIYNFLNGGAGVNVLARH